MESLLNKIAGLKTRQFIKKETPTQVFCFEYCERSKNAYFEEYLLTGASISLTINNKRYY